jgi:hypothetical protein
VPDGPRIFRHKTSADYWGYYYLLPAEIQTLASKNYELLKKDARHPSLQFKKVGKLWSVRIGLDHRALAVAVPEGFLWFWIGRHDEYDKILKG